MACAGPTDDTAGEEDPGSQEGAWDAESADNEAESTHLWIVDRGIDILKRHASEDPVAAKMVSILNDSVCRERWQQGLVDADFKAIYNNGRSDMPLHPNDAQVALAGATWESHFYDVDTGKNYKGATSPTAFTESQGHLSNAFENHLDQKQRNACYELGLTLHYFTDLTQPMHAANFTALSRPAKLHSNLEGYALEIQERFRRDDWSEKPTGEIKDFIHDTAKGTKPLFMEGVKAVVDAYKAYTGWHILTCRNIDAEPWRFVERQHLDYKYCWEGNPEVDQTVGHSLQYAQDRTAQFLYLVGSKLPGAADTNAPATTPADEEQP